MHEPPEMVETGAWACWPMRQLLIRPGSLFVLGLLLVGPAGLDSSHPGTVGPNALSYSNDCWGGVETSKLCVFTPVPA